MAARLATIADLPSCFSGVAAGEQQEALDLMAPLVNPAVAGPCALVTSQMHAALASHWLTLNPATAGAGNAMALAYDRKIDKIEVDGVDAEEFLSPFSLRRTKFGQLYHDLCNAHCGPSLMVV